MVDYCLGHCLLHYLDVPSYVNVLRSTSAKSNTTSHSIFLGGKRRTRSGSVASLQYEDWPGLNNDFRCKFAP